MNLLTFITALLGLMAKVRTIAFGFCYLYSEGVKKCTLLRIPTTVLTGVSYLATDHKTKCKSSRLGNQKFEIKFFYLRYLLLVKHKTYHITKHNL